MDPAIVAGLRWRLQFEAVWTPELPEIAASRIPSGLHGQDRIDFYKNRVNAQDLLTRLFPADEESVDG